MLKLGGKPHVPRYPGHDFFNVLMRANRSKDRGRFRQLAAQIAMLFLTRREDGKWRDTNAAAIDDFYYEHLGFDADSGDAKRLGEVLDKLMNLLPDHQKRKKIVGHLPLRRTSRSIPPSSRCAALSVYFNTNLVSTLIIKNVLEPSRPGALVGAGTGRQLAAGSEDGVNPHQGPIMVS